MESTNPIQKFKFPEDVILESQCVFEIEKFRAYKNDEKITSLKVEFIECDLTWWMQINPSINYYNTRISQFDVIIDLKSEELRKSKKYLLQLSATSNGVHIFKTSFKTFGEGAIIETSRIQYDDMLPRLKLNGSCVLIVKLEVKHLGGSQVRQMSYNSIDVKQQVSEQILDILNDPTFSDFTFIVKGKEFKVHKAILASAREMMRNMFTTNLKELAEGKYIVDDIEPNIFNHLLHFVYTGDIPIYLSDISMELFKAAHYYGLKNLMDICKQDVHLKLSADNALEACELASIYVIEDLKIDAWTIAKNQVLKVFFALENEPLSIQELREIISIKEKEKAFWLKHRKVNSIEEVKKLQH